VAEPASSVPDPFAMWRDWVSQSERQWNTFLNEAMASPQYGQSLGRFMELSLAMQKTMAEAMGRYLGALNMPTRTDVMALGERLATIEERLIGIELRLDQLSRPASDEAAPLETVPRPPRTKRPVEP